MYGYLSVTDAPGFGACLAPRARQDRVLLATAAVAHAVETLEPVTGEYPSAPRLPLLTLAEARDAVRHLFLLEQLDLSPRGAAAGQLASELARRLPAE